MGKFVLRAALIVGATLLLSVLAAFGYRAWHQHENAIAATIAVPPGIDEAGFVRIGGIEQWISIRGADRANPVLLLLHGGPGSTLSPMAPRFRGWEKDFTVVQWDQRGSGRTFGRARAGQGLMTIARMTRDGIELTRHLLARLHKRKLVLVGHSWGSELGLTMIKAEPGLFSAYVGTGQVVAKAEKEEFLYAALRAKLAAAHDTDGLTKLAAIGPPPYKSEAVLDEERHLQRRFDIEPERDLTRHMAPVVLFNPDMSLGDVADMFAGKDFAGEALYRESLGFDARRLGTDIAVPFFIFNGEYDSVTPTVLARRYFDSVRAPVKAFVVLKGGGHSAILTMPDAFLADLNRVVRPLAVRD
jgi:pimeloyl-ACP methyl ester carboxylesterase